ncbi:hypothetical protein ABZ749_34510, partial [Micromonospora sp. NPDC047753]|uniref:hypothetical protein n=1 Tax=Micromonospora sp. NPDC047753 TaxID=3154817 RepID=UPI0033EA50A0
MSQTERMDSVDEWNVAEDDGVLDASDTLDDDRVGDPLDTGIIAEDHWTAANRFGTTPAEERAGESLEQHLAQEVPDVDPYAEGGDDEDELTRRGYEAEARAGRLVAYDEGRLERCLDDELPRRARRPVQHRGDQAGHRGEGP